MEIDNHAIAWDIVNGFFAGLSLADVHTIDPSPVEFAGAFSRSWTAWKPSSSGELAEYKAGRYGYKALLYRARRPESLFHNYRTSIDALPNGLTIEQVLNTCARHASAAEWRNLASLYIRNTTGKEALSLQPLSVRSMAEQEPAPSISVIVPVQQRNGIRVPGGIVRRRRHTGPAVPGYYQERHEGGSQQNHRDRGFTQFEPG